MAVLRSASGHIIKVKQVAGRPEATEGSVSIDIISGTDTAVIDVGADVDGGSDVFVVANGVGRRVPFRKGKASVPLSYWYGESTPPTPVPFIVQTSINGVRAKPLPLDVTPASPPVSAPTVDTAPSISIAEIGQPVVFDIGAYTNMAGYSPSYEIRVDGVTKATNAEYQLVPEDDQKDVTIRVTATNAAGSVQSTSAAVESAFPEPTVAEVIPDIVATVGDDPFTASTAQWFAIIDPEAGDAGLYEGYLSYSVTGANASINATTGDLTVTFDSELSEYEVEVTVTNSGGSAAVAFNVTVGAASSVLPFPDPVADADWTVYEERTLSPVGRRTFDVDAGVSVPSGFSLIAYSGLERNGGPQIYYSTITPGTPLTTAGGYSAGSTLYNILAWRRDSDGAWGGISTERQFVVQGAYPAPTVIAPLPDITLTQNDPDPVLDGAAVFYATSDFQGSTFSVTGTGASINSSTGALTLDTASVLTNESIEVTATNGAGSDSDTFLLTVTATPGTEPFPAVLANNLWTSSEERDEAPEGRNKVLVNSSVSALYDNTKFDLLWSPTTNSNGIPEWAALVTPGTPYTTTSQSVPGTVIWSMLFWRRKVGGEVQLASNKFSWTMQGLNVQPPPAGLPVIPTATMTLVRNSGTFTIQNKNNTSGGRSPLSHGMTPIMMACRVAEGTASTADKNQLDAQVDAILTGSKGMICQGGYTMQHDLNHAACLAVVRNIPSVWNGLTATQRNKADALMQAAIAVGAWSTSDKQGTNNIRELAGYRTYKRNWNPNYRLAFIGMVLVGIPFFGSAAAVQDLLDNYNHNTLKNTLQNYGLTNTYNTWAKVGSANNAPSVSTVNDRIRDYRYYKKALTASNLMPILQGEADDMWSKIISKGWNGTGVLYDGVRRGWPIDTSGTPPNAGDRAMAKELDTTDGGGSCPGPCPRSALSYAVDGARCELNYLMALATTGFISRETQGMSAMMTRMGKGWQDLAWRHGKGYRSCAKCMCDPGGRETWTTSYGSSTYLFEAAASFYEDYAEPLLT